MPSVASFLKRDGSGGCIPDFLGVPWGFSNLRICYWLSLGGLGKHGRGEKYIFKNE